MENPLILHLFTPAAQASPFDVNMAYDAGYDAVVPYTGVTLADVAGLTQDAIFSRGPKRVRRTGICIGGRDLDLALDMLDAAREAMVPPFAVSVFADPSGAFTTAAAVVAVVEKHLRAKHDTALTGRRVLVLGGTGPVGTAAATLAAQEGAIVELASHSALGRAQAACDRIRTRYGLSLQAVQIDDGSAAKLIARAEVLIAAAKAGVEVVSEALLREARALLVAADVNAVPPAGSPGSARWTTVRRSPRRRRARRSASARLRSATSSTRSSGACSRACAPRTSRSTSISATPSRKRASSRRRAAERLPMTPTLVVVAISGRALAQSAAKTGSRVVVLDAFGDRDTRAIAEVVCVGADEGVAIDPGRLIAALGAEPRGSGLAIVVGSGFEGTPELASRLARYGRVYANDPAVVAALKDPEIGIALLRASGWRVPPTQREPPADRRGWLQKQTGGAGGTHVRPAGHARGAARCTSSARSPVSRCR